MKSISNHTDEELLSLLNSILQVHHKDGDCFNNSPNNVQLLCPNCHALTENWGNRNKTATRTNFYKRKLDNSSLNHDE